jgi:hypothetical protein
MAMLDHVRWIGGGTGASKTTIVHRLADESRLAVYSTDAAIRVHAARLGACAAPLLESFRRMSMDERWVLRDPAEMYRTFPWFHGEGFKLLVEDLRSLPVTGVVLVEGFRLQPDFVRPHLSDPNHAVWLIPTPEFRRAAFAARDRSEAFWMRTTDPGRAMANLLARDEIFTNELAADAASGGMRTLAVDGSRSLEATVATIARQFGLSTQDS